jgi:hypothetical protein
MANGLAGDVNIPNNFAADHPKSGYLHDFQTHPTKINPERRQARDFH